MHKGRLLILAAAIAPALACAGVQQATLSPKIAAERVSPPPLTERAPVAVKPPQSRVVVVARDVAHGSHPVRFEQFTGNMQIDAPTGWLELDIDATSLRADNGFAENLAQGMLETSKFPHATLVAKIAPGDSADTRVVTGNVTVHGIEHGITFRARVKKEGDAWRLYAVFDMSRSAFRIEADGAWDPLIKDDFRVTLDFRGAQ
jgi:polyisoprenoid-binding protein YceI